MNPNWQGDNFILNQSYKDIEYYGVIETKFENCTFNTILFYRNMITTAEFKNCTFENCTFAGVSFFECTFTKCHFANCKFIKSNVGTLCSSKNSNILDSFVDEYSLINNPLTIKQSKDISLLTTKLKYQLYKTFKISRPQLAVYDTNHCLACEETQNLHETLSSQRVPVGYFKSCYLSIVSFSTNAFNYYMPRLLELLLIGEENDWGCFQLNILDELRPTKYEDRFEYYNKNQINLIIQVLELVYNKYDQQESSWDYELERMTDISESEKLLENCKKSLVFWRGKLN